MDVADDICTIDDLRRDPRQLLNKVDQTRRPVMITMDGKPAALLISTELFPSKKVALNAACELAETTG